MGDIKVRDIIAGIGLFILFMAGMISIMSQFDSTNDDFIDNNTMEEFESAFDKQDLYLSYEADITNSTKTLKEPSKTDFIYMIFEGGWTTIQMSFRMVGMVDDIIYGIWDMFGMYIPRWMFTMIIAIITVFVGLIILGIFLQREI